jgi:hypothetical protein
LNAGRASTAGEDEQDDSCVSAFLEDWQECVSRFGKSRMGSDSLSVGAVAGFGRAFLLGLASLLSLDLVLDAVLGGWRDGSVAVRDVLLGSL